MRDELAAGTRHALLHRVAVAQVGGRAPSLVGAVGRAGDLLWAAGRGRVGDGEPDADTRYRIGSISKTFTAVLVLRLRDEGLLDLGDPVEAHLPGTPAGRVTVGQLLSHTAGLAAETPPPWWERSSWADRPDLTDALGERPERLPPGRYFHYSNAGFAVLGALAERLRGRPWFDLVDEEILQPLGMTRTSLMPVAPHASGWATHPWADLVLAEPAPYAGPLAPAGQLWSTATDLVRFGALLAGQRPAVLSGATVAEMAEPAPAGDLGPAGYGLGVQLRPADGRRLAGHVGSMPGFLAALWVQPEEDLVAVTFANATGGVPVDAVAADLIRIVADREPRIPPAWEPLAEFDEQLLGLTGIWHWGATPVALRLRADRYLELGQVTSAARGSRFRPRPDGTWVGLDGYYRGEVLTVVRDPDGGVSHLDVGSFVYTRGPYQPAGPIPGGVDPQGWRPAP